MKLLILTQYFPPETGAPQNRLFELGVRLQALGVEVTVLTAMPNYPKMEIFAGYEGKSYVYEEQKGLKVHRTSIFVSRSKGIVARLRNYFSFVISSARASGKLQKHYDLLLCESPPLFLGYAAMYLARRKNAKLIFNVSDLWPESAEKLGVVTNRMLLGLAYRLEAKLYRRSALVTGQTQGICADIKSRFPDVRTYWLPNGVDLSFYDPSAYRDTSWRAQNGISEHQQLFLYAGIIGIAQGLEVLLEAAHLVRERRHVVIGLLGAGPEKETLQRKAGEMDLDNVRFFDPVSKEQMPHILACAYAAIVPLKKLELFMGAIPSKIFESSAMQLPLLLGVDGEARTLFIEQGRTGLYFEPGNAADLAGCISALSADPQHARQLGANGREFVSKKFNRDSIARNFLEELKKYAHGTHKA